MSFILDALKKSDAERQKRSTPGFADIPESRERRHPQRWMWIVGALLIINLGALLALLFRPQKVRVDNTPTEQTRTSPEPAAEPDRSFSDIVAEARKSQPKASQPAAATPRQHAATDEPPGAAPAVAAPAGKPEKEIEPTATFDSLRADGTLKLPDLHLDIHVYSDNPAERFVFINMKKYRENETLAEGPAVKRIAPEGVILEQSGKVFLLPRE